MKKEIKYLDHSLYIDWIFQKTFKNLPYFRKYSPGISVVGDSNAVTKQAIQDLVKQYQIKNLTPSFLDFGARDGSRQTFAKNCDYTGVDINPRGDGIIQGDICACPHIPDESYDIVFSFDVLEHVERPWDAASESIRITRKGGANHLPDAIRISLSPRAQ